MSDVARKSQVDVVIQRVKRLILDGDLVPGDQLPIEKELASEFGVSRGSLREGVSALAIMGVLETRQGAGTFVTSLDATRLFAPVGFLVDLQRGAAAEHLHAVRRVLETEAAGLAALLMGPEVMAEAAMILDRFEGALESGASADHELLLALDIQFHQLVAMSSGNLVLGSLIEVLAGRSFRGRLRRAIAEENAEWATLAEHRSILRALTERSPDRARVRMANHLLVVEEFLKDRQAPVGRQ